MENLLSYYVLYFYELSFDNPDFFLQIKVTFCQGFVQSIRQ